MAALPGPAALSRYVGRPVVTAGGGPAGSLRDLSVHLGEEHPAVDRMLLGSRRRITHLVPWSLVADDRRREIRLSIDDLGPYAVPDGLRLGDHELLLVRDVLDTQIVDVVGYRVSRVGEVLLAGADHRLEVVAVEVGLRAVLRRLRLGFLADRLPERAVDWADLHLTSDRGHLVQLRTKAAALHRLDAQGLAELITRLDVTSAVDVVRTVDSETATAAMDRLHSGVAHGLNRAMGAGPAARPARLRRLEGWRIHRPRRHHEPRAR